MSGIFPNATDGGLPPNPDDTSNPARAYAPVTPPISTAALYYGNGCDVRLRPEVVNSLISEQEALVDIAQLAYNPARQINMQLAVRYLIQRGMPRAIALQSTAIPNQYIATLDPPSTEYSNFMTLSVVPVVNNTSAPTISVDGHGFVPILRNDGLPLQINDMLAGVPFEVIYNVGAFYVVGMVPSQVPTAATDKFFDLEIHIFDVSTTYTIPSYVHNIMMEGWAAGGGGAAGNGVSGGGGGGGGEYGLGYFRVIPGQVLNMVVGLGGMGNNSPGNYGLNGGSTAVTISGGANLMTLIGGGGGLLPGMQGSTPGQGGSINGGGEIIAGSGGFVPNSTWGGGSPGGGTARGRMYAMQGNSGLPPGGGGSGNQSDNFYTPTQLKGGNGRVKITHLRGT